MFPSTGRDREEVEFYLVCLSELHSKGCLPISANQQNNDNAVEEEQQRALELAQQVLGKCNHSSITYYS